LGTDYIIQQTKKKEPSTKKERKKERKHAEGDQPEVHQTSPRIKSSQEETE
jgi:hypothetical protein